MNKHVLIAMSSHDTMTNGQKTGTFLPEVAHAYWVFEKAGFKVSFISVKGGEVPLYETDRDEPTIRFAQRPTLMQSVHSSLTADDVKAEAFDAIYFAGGHGTMWDFPKATKLQKLGATIYEQGGIVAAVCHGPAIFDGLNLTNGTPLIRGKKVAAFTNEEERATELNDVVPFLLQTRLENLGAKVLPAGKWQPQVVIDERVITGQNPASAEGVATKMVEALRAQVNPVAASEQVRAVAR